MKTISTDLENYLHEPVVALAVLCLVERTDGVTLAFTNWDQSIVYDGNTYLPAISMSPSSIKTNADLTTDQMDILGAIDSEYIKDEDIEGGRYDYARITFMRICPYNVSWGVINDLYGTTGQIDFGDGLFQIAFNSLGQKLSQTVGDIVTADCPVNNLGDFQCKVDLSLYRTDSTVDATDTENRLLQFTSTKDTGYYDYGMCRFKSSGSGGGLNYLLNGEVKTSIGNGHSVLTLITGLTSGTFLLTVSVDGGVTKVTTALAYNASASAIQTALRALSNVGSGNMNVTDISSGGVPIFQIDNAGALSGHYVGINVNGTLLATSAGEIIPSQVEVLGTGNTSLQLFLQEPMPFPVIVGDAVVLEAGCDRKPLTCRNKFSNLVNYHGYYTVPGNSFLLSVGGQ